MIRTVKTLLILNDVHYSESIGGQSTFIKNLHPYLSKEYDCYYCILPKKLRNQNIIPHRLLYALYVLQFLVRRKKKTDIILSHTPEASFVASFFSIPLIHIFHGNNNPVTTSKFWYGKYFRNIFDLFEKRIAQKAVKQFTVGETRGDIQKIWNPIIKGDQSIDSERKNLVFAGRFESVKNIHKIIDAYVQLPSEITNNHDLILIGTGTLIDSLQEKACKSPLTDKIKFLGQQDNSFVAKELSLSAVLVMASQYEGFPMIVAESLTCGTPVISTPVGDIPSIIKNNYNGRLINQENYIQEFQEAVSGILKNCKEYSSNALKSSTIFDAEQVTKNLIENINTVCYS